MRTSLFSVSLLILISFAHFLDARKGKDKSKKRDDEFDHVSKEEAVKKWHVKEIKDKKIEEVKVATAAPERLTILMLI